MKVDSIFESCQGEGLTAGIPMTFIRLQGCNLVCPVCDSKQTWGANGFDISVDSIIDRVETRGLDWVCITGGEPMIHGYTLRKLVADLVGKGYKVEIETNGSYKNPAWFISRGHYRFVTDIKCPSSGYTPTRDVIESWLVGRHQDSLKFVVSNRKDLEFVHNFLLQYETELAHYKGTVIVSPVFPLDIDWAREVWEFCVANNLRFSLQIHKVLFGNDKER